MAVKTLPSAETLHELFFYDPQTGILTRRKATGHRWKVGSLVGTPMASGHIQVKLGSQTFYAHRLIWKMMTGEDPVAEIDHRDTDPGNNRWQNLRQATHGQNGANKPVRSDSRTGLKGVTPFKNRFMAQIRVGGKQHYLGLFKSPEAAHEAYCAAALRLHGTFARGSKRS